MEGRGVFFSSVLFSTHAYITSTQLLKATNTLSCSILTAFAVAFLKTLSMEAKENFLRDLNAVT